jgi:hypothetical protein
MSQTGATSFLERVATTEALVGTLRTSCKQRLLKGRRSA